MTMNTVSNQSRNTNSVSNQSTQFRASSTGSSSLTAKFDNISFTPPATLKQNFTKVAEQHTKAIREVAAQGVGFVKGVGEVIGETASGIYTLGKNSAATYIDIVEGGKLDLADKIISTTTGHKFERPEWMPNRQRGVERLEQGGKVLQGVIENPKVLWQAVADPIKEDWNAGRYGEAVGRGAAETAGILLGTKGVDKLGKSSKLITAVDKLDSATRNQAIQERILNNAKLRESLQFEVDMQKVGVSEEKIDKMWKKEDPLGFSDERQFTSFKKDLSSALKSNGLKDAEVGLKGTSTTFYSENPHKPLGHHWDADPLAKGDYDLNVTSQKMINKLEASNIKPSDKYGVYKTRDMNANFPALDKFQKEWSSTLDRDVNFVGYPEPRIRDKTEFLLTDKSSLNSFLSSMGKTTIGGGAFIATQGIGNSNHQVGN